MVKGNITFTIACPVESIVPDVLTILAPPTLASATKFQLAPSIPFIVNVLVSPEEIIAEVLKL